MTEEGAMLAGAAAFEARDDAGFDPFRPAAR